MLDEPTAGLDGATEADVVRTIRRLVRGRTVVVVAHRPALLAVADRVVDLGAGRRRHDALRPAAGRVALGAVEAAA